MCILDGTWVSYEYPRIVVDSESNNYAWATSLDGSSDPVPFSTYDRDNDNSPYVNCAKQMGGGWAYDKNCYTPYNLHGDYDKHFEDKTLGGDAHFTEAQV